MHLSSVYPQIKSFIKKYPQINLKDITDKKQKIWIIFAKISFCGTCKIRNLLKIGLQRVKNMDKEQPLISVIVPVYNVEKYLKKCVNSITSQTYENLEILLVDDGSTDSSGQICFLC